MSGKHWTKEQEQFLIDNCNDVDLVTKTLNKSIESIKQKAFRLGILPKSTAKTWTFDEDVKLRQLYGNRKITNNQLSQIFGRSIGSIQTHAIRLGIERKKWSKEHENLVVELYDGSLESIDKLSELTCRTKCSVVGKVQKLGLAKPVNYWTEEEERILCDNYLTLDKDKLMQFLPNRTWHGIVNRAGVLKIGHRLVDYKKYNYNYDYFKEINTEEKAYWLGFIYADGSVGVDPRPSLRISLVTEGKKHLEKFAKAVEFSGDVLGPYYAKWKYKGISRTSEYFSLNFNEKSFVENLINYGVVPNKTYVVKFPDIDPDLQRHFIRGVFDGDGCITHKKTKGNNKTYVAPSMNFVGAAPDFLRHIVNVFSERVGVRQVSVIKRKGKGSTWLFSYQGTPALRIRDWIYTDSTVWMECKKDKFYSYDYSVIKPQDKEHQQQIIDAEMTKRCWKRLSEYKGWEGELTIKCEKGHIWTTKTEMFKLGKGCPQCCHIRTSERMIEKCKNNLLRILAKRRWELISEYTSNRNSEIQIKCEHNKIVTMKRYKATRSWTECGCKLDMEVYGKYGAID